MKHGGKKWKKMKKNEGKNANKKNAGNGDRNGQSLRVPDARARV
jgi:hypothetical protein